MTDRKGLSRVLMTADPIGGVWDYAVELARGLAASGVATSLAVSGGPVEASRRTALAAIPGLTLDEAPFRLEWMTEPEQDLRETGDWLLDLERRLRPDVVHVNGYAAAALPFKAPTLCVAHTCVRSWWQAVHGEPAPAAWDAYGARVAMGLHLADHVVAPTRAMMEAVREHYGALPRSSVIGHGCDPLRYRPLAKRPVVLAVGRLWDEAKNVGAIDAVARGLAWPVLVAGESRAPDCTSVRQLRHARPLGRLTPEKLAACYGQASIFLHPARFEPFGLAPLEAAMAGCALVLGDIPSLRELWDGAAVFVAPDDHRGLARTLDRLITDPERRAGLALAARRRSRSHSASRMVRGYLDAYGALTNVRTLTAAE